LFAGVAPKMIWALDVTRWNLKNTKDISEKKN